MIQLFEKDATSFERMGITVLKPVSCIVHEEKNGDFSLEMVVAEDDELCREERIVFAPTPKNGNQPFRIYDVERQIGVEKRVKARHVFYDLLDNFLEDVRPTGNGAFALQRLLNETQYPSGFTGTSDIETSATAYWEMKNPVEALIGTDENSFVNRWGGVADRDKFTVTMRKNGGRDNAVRIRYGKNLESCGLHCNYENIVTRIMPTGLKADGQTLLKLPEKYVDSEHVNEYNAPKILRVHYSNIKVGESEGSYPTEEEACAALRAAAKSEFESGADLPEITGTISVVDLRQTREYKTVKALETIYPFDTLEVEMPGENGKMTLVSVDMQAYDYNCLTENYTKITIGEQNYIGDLVKTVLKKVSDKLSEEGIASLPERVQQATELITTALGGHVVKRENELLIMDTKDPKTASRVWRWNLNGLGYSKTGYEGPYALAMTMDGQINADFITVGTLSANLIKSGVLMSKNGASWINMDDGTFCFRVVKDAWMDVDTGEMSYEYQKVLELTDKFLHIYGVLKSTEFPNLSVSIGSLPYANAGGAFAVSDINDEGAMFTVYKDSGNSCYWEASLHSTGNGYLCKYIKTTEEDIYVENYNFGKVVYFKAGKENFEISNGVLSIGSQHASFQINSNFSGNVFFNFYEPKEGNYYVERYIFCRGTGSGSDVADVSCKNVYSYGKAYVTDLISIGSDSENYKNYKLSVFGKACADTWEVNSDRNAKENIVEKSDITAIDGIKSLRFYAYDYKTHEDTQKSEAESTWETVQAVKLNTSTPVTEEKSEKTPVHVELGIMTDEAPAEILGIEGKSINLYAYSSYIAKAVQELIEKSDEQEKRIAALETELQALKNEKSTQ